MPESPAIPLDLIDPHALQAVRRLRSAGFKAYLVGGCVRDLLLELTPKDFDIATDANPEEIRRIFRNSRIIGRRFRLVHLYFRDGKIIEVSTFRAMTNHDDSSSEEGADLLIRRDNIFGTEEEDALRRDFTINGLFFDVVSGEIIDHVGGLADLKTRCLRMIGDPEIRLREDPVRILRAIRFVAKTSLHLDPSLAAAMVRHRDEISRCSAPRILEETLRLLRIGHSEKTVALLEETGLLNVLLPELQAYLGPTEAPAEARHVRLYGYLRALDEMVRRDSVSDTVALAALMAAPIEDLEADAADAGTPGASGALAPGGGAKGSRHRLVTDFIIAIGQRISLTRKLTEQLRQVFMAQKFFGEPQAGPGSRRRSRATPAALMKRGFFPDALKFYEVRVHALGLPGNDLELWKGRLDRAQTSLPGPADTVGVPEARRRAPRRPRRRR
ncbi:MAG: polynucleotide adenylyltransferase PcnB [Deltaproteobacteria bacterium]|nr:polynucleotide adenylyltransferase PcnB [Deltaproteobacteria bacterium]